MAKGLVQKATRKQALSYTRYAPNRRRRARRESFLSNPLGVTSIAAINGRRRARSAAGTTVVIEKGGRTKTIRGTKAVSYLKKHHPRHAKKSDFGRLRLAFTTRSGERVSISPKATSRRTSDLSERVQRLSKKEKALAKKVSARRHYPRGVKKYSSRARYERALVLLQAKKKRKKGKPLSRKAKLSRAARTMEKAAARKRSTKSARKRSHKKASHRRSTKATRKRTSHKRALSKLPMRAYYASERGSRIKGSPVIGIREEDVVVVPARRNGISAAAAKKKIDRNRSVLRSKKSTKAEKARARRYIKEIQAARRQTRAKKSSPRYKTPRFKSKAARKAAIKKLWAGRSDSEVLRGSRKKSVRQKAGKKAAITRRWKAKMAEYGYPKTEPTFSTPVHKMTGKRRAAAMKKIRAYEKAVEKAEQRYARARKNGSTGDDMRANKKRATKKGHKRTRRSSARGGLGLLKARIGKKTYRTYMVTGKKGKVVHVPRYRLLGFKSERALQKVLQGSDEKKAEKISKRLTAIYKRRAKAAERIKKHGDAFTPNARVSYEEWKKNAMEPNKRKGRKGRKGKGRHSKSGSSGWTKAKRRAAAKKAAATRKRRHASRSAAARKGARKRRGGHKKGHHHAKRTRRASKKRGSKKAHHKGGRKRSRSAAGKARWRAMSAAQKKKVLAALARGRKKHHGGRKGKKSYRKNGSTALANYRGNHAAIANRRHRHYRSNRKFTMNGMMASVKEALGTGAVATVGFVAHRGIGWLLSEKLLTKVGIFADASTSTASPPVAGSLAPYRRIIAGLVVAAAGIPAIEKIAPKQANTVAAGMVVSLLHQVIVTAMGQFVPTYVPALAGYGDRSGRAFRSFPGGMGRGPMGEYFLTGQNGYGRSPMGEYFLTGMNGFGAAPGRRPSVTQAAAGMGQYSQAAAGFGQVYQAAAGTPMLSQAAAGVGEYFLTGANGYGDYEMVQPSGQSGAQTVVDEGIMGGDTHAAERALNISEGVAGISDNGIGVQNIVDPTDVAVPVSDEPMGSRAGILQGQEGIFG